MSVYLIADLHLSKNEQTNKSMDVFGSRWLDYMTKLETNWRRLVNEDDTVIIPGDISWAISLDEAKPDFDFLESLPGKKILMKGNHDFWWSSLKKLQEYLQKNNYKTITFFYHSAIKVENAIICGTRGWFPEENEVASKEEVERIIAREAIRLEMSLVEGVKLQLQNPKCPIYAFFHFPPYWNNIPIEPLTNLLEKYNVKGCFFGHIHSQYNLPQTNIYNEIPYTIISSDYLNFIPKLFVY